MIYKNTTKEILRFKTHEANGTKTSFVLKPNEKVDLYRDNLQIEGLEKVDIKSNKKIQSLDKEKKTNKTKKGDE